MKIVTTCRNAANETPLYKSLYHYGFQDEVEFIEYNTQPLPVVYNKFLKDGDIDHVVFMHSDISLICDFKELKSSLTKWHKLTHANLIGVAGCGDATIQTNRYNLWHWMAEPGTLLGEVYHAEKEIDFPIEHNKKYNVNNTVFGPKTGQALLVDGLFMSYKKSKDFIALFDESNPYGFHLYDLDFCLTIKAYGLNTYVCHVPLIHYSPGLDTNNKTEVENFEKANKWFVNKWQHLI